MTKEKLEESLEGYIARRNQLAEAINKGTVEIHNLDGAIASTNTLLEEFEEDKSNKGKDKKTLEKA